MARILFQDRPHLLLGFPAAVNIREVEKVDPVFIGGLDDAACSVLFDLAFTEVDPAAQ